MEIFAILVFGVICFFIGIVYGSPVYKLKINFPKDVSDEEWTKDVWMVNDDE